MSRAAVAKGSGTSVPTLSRAELGDDVRWKRSTHIRVLSCLDKRAPITDEDFAEYVKSAGLEGFARAALAAADSPSMRRAVGLRDVLEMMEPAEATAHTWLVELIEELGATTVLEGLQGLAAVATIRLSDPRVHGRKVGETVSGPRMLVTPPHIEDGIEVQEFVPVPKPSPKAPRSIDTNRIPKRG